MFLLSQHNILFVFSDAYKLPTLYITFLKTKPVFVFPHRGSLAGQLSKIINREKSAVRFWHHSSKEEAVDGTILRNYFLH